MVKGITPGYIKINPPTHQSRAQFKHQETQKEHNSVPFRNHIQAIKAGIYKRSKYTVTQECSAL